MRQYTQMMQHAADQLGADHPITQQMCGFGRQLAGHQASRRSRARQVEPHQSAGDPGGGEGDLEPCS